MSPEPGGLRARRGKQRLGEVKQLPPGAQGRKCWSQDWAPRADTVPELTRLRAALPPLKVALSIMPLLEDPAELGLRDVSWLVLALGDLAALGSRALPLPTRPSPPPLSQAS